MKKSSKYLARLGVTLLVSSTLLAACSSTTSSGNKLKLDTEAANSTSLAKETANGKDVQMYDTSRAKMEDHSKVNSNQAKYVFLFIGDGMGVTPVTAAEDYLGYTQTNKGEVYPDRMNFTEMPVVGLKTQYDCSSFIPDSAATATAFATGIKTQSKVIGLTGDLEKSADSVAEKAKRAGKAVGIVTNVTLNHATPAAFYANVESRKSYYDIGLQMAESGFDYFAGGSLGQRTGKDEDQKDLYEVMEENGYTIADTKEKAEKINADSEKVYLVSERLQDSGSMPYTIDQEEGDQTLSDMVAKGIEVMEDDPEGFFMMVEGGKVDWAEHANDGLTTIHEVLGFEESIQTAIDFYNEHPDEILIVVTADHATGGFTIGNGSTGNSTYFDLLTNQKGSQVAFADLTTEALEKNPDLTFEEFAPQIEDYFGLVLDPDAPSEDVTNAESEAYAEELAKNRLKCSKEEYNELKTAFDETKKSEDEQNVSYGGYVPIAITATRLLDKKAGLAWTTTDHSGDKVPVYAMGSGAKMFDGEYDDTDISIRLGEAMGFNGDSKDAEEQVETETKKPTGVGLKQADK